MKKYLIKQKSIYQTVIILFFIISLTISCNNHVDKKKINITNKNSNIDNIKVKDYSTTKNIDINNKPEYYYDDTASILIGTLTVKSYFGPPGYGESPSIDSKEEEYILILEKPINVIQRSKKDEEEGIDVTKFNNKKIQLVILGDINLDPFINKKIKVSGSFFGAISGHHHTPVLLQVSKAELLK